MKPVKYKAIKRACGGRHPATLEELVGAALELSKQKVAMQMACIKPRLSGKEWNRRFMERLGYPLPRVMPAEKQCTRCSLVKPAADFHRCNAHHTLLRDWCKRCQYAYQRERYARMKSGGSRFGRGITRAR